MIICQIWIGHAPTKKHISVEYIKHILTIAKHLCFPSEIWTESTPSLFLIYEK